MIINKKLPSIRQRYSISAGVRIGERSERRRKPGSAVIRRPAFHNKTLLAAAQRLQADANPVVAEAADWAVARLQGGG